MTAIPPAPATLPVCVPWYVDTSCCTTAWGAASTAVKERAAAMAWRTIKLLTAGRMGSCEVTMRPCLSTPCESCDAGWMAPFVVNGQWCNAACGSSECSCVRLCEIEFPGEVAEIRNISLNGFGIGPDMWRIEDGNTLIRQDDGCWPSCQNRRRPLGENCTFGITYVPGVKPDSYALYAAGVLACEFIKACTGGTGCRLPKGVQTISRQGVSMTLTASMWPGGLTSISEVDALISSLNPDGRKHLPKVWSPDLPRHKHHYTTLVPDIPEEEV